MQPQESAELKTMIEQNSNDRMAVVMAHQNGSISFAEMTRELKRLDKMLTIMLADWSADHSLFVPVLAEDLVCRSISVLQENQYN